MKTANGASESPGPLDPPALRAARAVNRRRGRPLIVAQLIRPPTLALWWGGGGPAAPRVLVVDDDQALSRMVSLVLRQSDFDVDVANDGDDAIRQATERAYDAVVLDLRMPGKDGRAVFRELRQLGVMTPVLILSAYDARRAQLELGAEAYMEKPFEPEVLVDGVRQLIGAA